MEGVGLSRCSAGASPSSFQWVCFSVFGFGRDFRTPRGRSPFNRGCEIGRDCGHNFWPVGLVGVEVVRGLKGTSIPAGETGSLPPNSLGGLGNPDECRAGFHAQRPPTDVSRLFAARSFRSISAARTFGHLRSQEPVMKIARPSFRSPRRTGFTLIELLVVISI